MKGIIDRFEGKYALIETAEGLLHVIKTQLPDNAIEGSHLIINDGHIILDQEATEAAKRQALDLLKDLTEK